MSLFGKKPELEPQRPPMEEPRPPPPPTHPYGISDAMRLMRSLPVDQNTELVVRVIRTTLESIGVHVSEIIEDASRRQQIVQERITALEGEIAEHTREVEARRAEIGRLQADLAETTLAKERLQLAEKASLPSKPPLPHAPVLMPNPPPPPPRTPSVTPAKPAEPEAEPEPSKP